MIKSLSIVTRLYALRGQEQETEAWLKAPDVLAALTPIAELATAKGMGGSLRVTAMRSA
jgi:hypothetical protein